MRKTMLIGAFLMLLMGVVTAQTKKVGMLIGTETIDAIESADERDAAQWFQTTYPEGVIVTPSTLVNIKEVSTLWIAVDRAGLAKGWTNLPEAFRTSETMTALTNHVKAGGSLFLTNHATQLVAGLGRIAEQYAPGIFGSGNGGQNPDVWGVQPIIGNAEGQIYDHSQHAIYKDMDFVSGLYKRSIYCFEGAGVKGDHNCMWDLNAYGLAAEPNVVKTWEDLTNSEVLGTWNHVVDYCCAGIVDFAPTTDFAGRILAVGLASYEWNIGGDNPYKGQLELFTKNSLSYLLAQTNKDFNYQGGVVDVPEDDPVGTPLAKVDGKVAMLIGYESVEAIEDDDERATAEWFKTTFADGIIVTPSTLSKLSEVNTVWVAIDRADGMELGWINLPSTFTSSAVITALANHVKAGGSLLLTNHATQLLTAIGRLDGKYAPGIFGAGAGGSNGEIWGINAEIGANPALEYHYDHSDHAIYTGLGRNNTLYTDHSFYQMIGAGWKEDHNCMWDFNSEAYELEEAPNRLADFEAKTTSTVLGAWQHVTDYACAGLIEFRPVGDFKGTVLANGLAAYEWKQNDVANPYQTNVEYLTQNALYYLNSLSTKATTAIGRVAEAEADDACYSLTGVKTVQPKTGLYIKNHKKYISK